VVAVIVNLPQEILMGIFYLMRRGHLGNEVEKRATLLGKKNGKRKIGMKPYAF
jgi:hypothetical protein